MILHLVIILKTYVSEFLHIIYYLLFHSQLEVWTFLWIVVEIMTIQRWFKAFLIKSGRRSNYNVLFLTWKLVDSRWLNTMKCLFIGAMNIMKIISWSALLDIMDVILKTLINESVFLGIFTESALSNWHRCTWVFNSGILRNRQSYFHTILRRLLIFILTNFFYTV